MTAPTSPKELLHAYRADARRTASQNNKPQNRSDFPGLVLTPTGMIYTRGKGLFYHPTGKAPEELTTEKASALLKEEGASTVVSDMPTFARLQLLAKDVTNDFGSLTRRLSIVRGLPGSVKMPILTEALSYRYWMQSELNDSSITDWAKAFGVAAPSQSITMRALVELALDGSRPAGLGYATSQKKLEEHERRIMENAEWGGIANDVQTYGGLERFTTEANALRTIDPGLLAMHKLDGTVSQVSPLNVTAKDFTTTVSSPFKLKEGSKVRLTDGENIADSSLRSMQYNNESLNAVFDAPPVRGPGALMVKRAKEGTAPLFATTAPFSSFPARLDNKRWFASEIEHIGGREVPLDVVLAGAPVA